MVELKGEIVWTSGMWTSVIKQDGKEFVLEEYSEMSSEPQVERFSRLEDAIVTMFSHT